MNRLPRYVQAIKKSGRPTEYRFNPPQTLVDEGVVKREMYGSDVSQVILRI